MTLKSAVQSTLYMFSYIRHLPLVLLWSSSALLFSLVVTAQGPTTAIPLCGAGEFARITAQGLTCATLTVSSDADVFSSVGDCSTGKYLTIGRDTNSNPVPKCLSLPNSSAVVDEHRLLPSAGCAVGETIRFDTNKQPECVSPIVQGAPGPAGQKGQKGLTGPVLGHSHSSLSATSHTHTSIPVTGGTCPTGQCIYKVNTDSTVECRSAVAVDVSDQHVVTTSFSERIGELLVTTGGTEEGILHAQTGSLCVAGEYVKITENGLVCTSAGVDSTLLDSLGSCGVGKFITLGRNTQGATLTCLSLPVSSGPATTRLLPVAACTSGQTVTFTADGDPQCGSGVTVVAGSQGPKGPKGSKGDSPPAGQFHTHDGLASHTHSHGSGEVSITGGSCSAGECAYALNTDGTVSCRNI